MPTKRIPKSKKGSKADDSQSSEEEDIDLDKDDLVACCVSQNLFLHYNP